MDAGEGHRRLILAAGIAALTAAAPAGAAAAVVQPVSVQFAAFAPAQVDVLPGDTVEWSNVSPREHTVTATAFASDLPAGARFSWTFESVGAYAYRCTIHASMTGEVDVRRITLGPLPTTALTPGSRVDFAGRTADPATPVRIERDTGGGRFAVVASVTPKASGEWSAKIAVRTGGAYRAAAGADASETRRLLVDDRRVRVRRTRRGVSVDVTPSDPYGRIVLEQRLRERFGWWPVARRRLDFLSHASLRVRRRAPIRVLLVGRDGWTPLATSPVLRAGHVRR